MDVREPEKETGSSIGGTAAMDVRAAMDVWRWRDLALTVPGTLMLVSTRMEAFNLIEAARTKLDERAKLIRMIRYGARLETAVEHFADPVPEGVLPSDVIEDARRAISHNAALHASIGHIFVSYCKFLGINDDEPACERWKSHFHEAVAITDEALDSVNDTASQAEAVKDIADIVGSLPVGCPLREHWALAGEQLMNLAANNATMALVELRRMRHAVSLEFFDAWVLLNRR
ncbi:hypothetical protein GUJ93_ZPchr0001g30052 [Zizania palustris]|uniref:Uncharacterized protein n=1 Tax=Zizania palustris TaxID=103762 RepID=A0A8J5RNP4_ZIZPA|nr:hypothetical protein GUJ93_ZPchr0001g30052 [Zizania palustris]